MESCFKNEHEINLKTEDINLRLIRVVAYRRNINAHLFRNGLVEICLRSRDFIEDSVTDQLFKGGSDKLIIKLK